MTTDTITTEIELRAEITRLRSVLARIEGFAAEGARNATSTMERGNFAWIAEQAKTALDRTD